MGEDMISLGYVVGLDYADATLSAHDVLQQFKTHPFIREMLEGGKRLAWGAKTIPGGGFYGLPSRLHVPGAVLVGDSAGFVDMMALKGVQLRDPLGHPRRRGHLRGAEGRQGHHPGGPLGLRPAHPLLGDLEGPLEGPQHPPRLPEGLPLRRHGPRHGDRLDGPRAAQAGQVQDGRQGADLHRRPRGELPEARRAVHLRQALERLRERQRDPRRPAEPHPHPDQGAPRARGRLGEHVPGARSTRSTRTLPRTAPSP